MSKFPSDYRKDNASTLVIDASGAATISFTLPSGVMLALENLWMKTTQFVIGTPYPATFQQTLTYVLQAITSFEPVPFANSSEYEIVVDEAKGDIRRLKERLDDPTDTLIGDLLALDDYDNFIVDLGSIQVNINIVYESNDILGAMARYANKHLSVAMYPSDTPVEFGSQVVMPRDIKVDEKYSRDGVYIEQALAVTLKNDHVYVTWERVGLLD